MVLMKNLFRDFVLLFIVIFYSCTYGFAYDEFGNKKIPNTIIEFAEQRKDYFGNDYSIYYIMKWHKYEVYRIKKKTYGIVYTSPRYILFDGKKIIKPTIDEYKKLEWDVRLYTNKILSKNNKILTKKLSHNAKKIMEIEDNTEPPEVPQALYKYANKYMIKGDDVGFLYLMDWEGQHVYRTYWKRYGFIFNPLTVILYDGRTIRRPSQLEFDIIKPLLQHAYENYLNEQARLHSKG